MLIFHMHIFFVKMSIKIFSPFSYRVFGILITVLWEFSVYSGYKSFIRHNLQNSLPLCGMPFHFLDDVFWNTKGFNCNEMQVIYFPLIAVCFEPVVLGPTQGQGQETEPAVTEWRQHPSSFKCSWWDSINNFSRLKTLSLPSSAPSKWVAPDLLVILILEIWVLESIRCFSKSRPG